MERSEMQNVIYTSPAAAEIMRKRGITIDGAPVTKPTDSQPLNEAEKLELFFRAHGRVHPDQETELAALRMMNAANRERW